jgi:hypothetical protein
MSPRGVTNYQQDLTGKVEATVILGERRRALTECDCLDPSLGQCCMRPKDREVDFSRFSDLLEAVEKGRRFDV